MAGHRRFGDKMAKRKRSKLEAELAGLKERLNCLVCEMDYWKSLGSMGKVIIPGELLHDIADTREEIGKLEYRLGT